MGKWRDIQNDKQNKGLNDSKINKFTSKPKFYTDSVDSVDSVKNIKAYRNRTDSVDSVSVSKGVMGNKFSADQLIGSARAAYDELLEEILSDKYKGTELELSFEEAQKKALETIAKSSKIIEENEKENAKQFIRQGWIKIYSTYIHQSIYLIKNKSYESAVPDKSIPTFTMKDIQALRGLTREEATPIITAKILFGGSITIEGE